MDFAPANPATGVDSGAALRVSTEYVVRIELSLQLERDPATNAPTGEVADELIALGGWMTNWSPQSEHRFGYATFVFADRRDCDRFLRAALQVPGVYRDLDAHVATPAR